jgi:hypothetical protein
LAHANPHLISTGLIFDSGFPNQRNSDSYYAQRLYSERVAGSVKIARAKDQWLVFCSFPGKVDPTDNGCERALRPAVIQRKVTNGYRAMWAAEYEVAVANHHRPRLSRGRRAFPKDHANRHAVTLERLKIRALSAGLDWVITWAPHLA